MNSYFRYSHLVACTSTGDLSYTPLNSRKNETKTILDLGPDLEVMRSHPTKTHIFAIGGKERDLCIYDIKEIAKSKKEVEGIDAAGPNKNTSLHKNKSAKNVGLLFQAKNVKNDFLDLQQPVWIHDLQFVNKEATKVAVATHHHQVRCSKLREGVTILTSFYCYSSVCMIQRQRVDLLQILRLESNL